MYIQCLTYKTMIVLLSYHILVVFGIYLIVLCSFIFVILDDAEEQVHIYCSYLQEKGKKNEAKKR